MLRFFTILLITAFGILASFKDAFYGLLLYAFYTFGHVVELAPWTPLKELRLSFVVAFVVIGTAILQGKRVIVKHTITLLCIFFLIQCSLSLAMNGYGLEIAVFVLKMQLITFVTAALIDNFEKIKKYFLIVAPTLGVFAAYYGVFGLFAGSTYITGNMEQKGDNNHYALWVNMGLPIVWYVGSMFKRASLRHIFKLIFAANILTSILTFSRGGFLTLIILLALIFVKKKTLPFVAIGLSVIAVFLFLQPEYSSGPEHIARWESGQVETVPGQTFERFGQRVGTLKEGPTQVSTAQSRISFWKTAVAMANANPIFGVGFMQHFQNYEKYDISGGLFGTGQRAIHNSFFCILAGTGYPGFFLFGLIILSYFKSLKRSRDHVLRLPDSERKSELQAYIRMLFIIMCAYVIGGSFIDEPTSEIFWAMLGVTIAVERITANIGRVVTEEDIPLDTNEHE